MFGTYRTLLALMVVTFHIGRVPIIGEYAVFGFYTLSGYLMTLIMQKNYHYTLSGMGKYALNRFLRIYPLYWISIVMSLALIAGLGEEATRAYHHAIFLPDTLANWLKNILLIFPSGSLPRLTPPAWALTVELFYYICIGLGLSRYRWLVFVWLSAGVGYHIVTYLAGMEFSYRYYPIEAASLPFATGALIYHYKDSIDAWLSRTLGSYSGYVSYLVFGMVIINWYTGVKTGHSHGISFYINYVLCVMMVMLLMSRTTLPFISRRFDKWMGDLSYPIYLIHYQVALFVIVVLQWTGTHVTRPDTLLMTVSIPVIMLVSLLLAKTVELPVEGVRSMVKKWR